MNFVLRIDTGRGYPELWGDIDITSSYGKTRDMCSWKPAWTYFRMAGECLQIEMISFDNIWYSRGRTLHLVLSWRGVKTGSEGQATCLPREDTGADLDTIVTNWNSLKSQSLFHAGGAQSEQSQSYPVSWRGSIVSWHSCVWSALVSIHCHCTWSCHRQPWSIFIAPINTRVTALASHMTLGQGEYLLCDNWWQCHLIIWPVLASVLTYVFCSSLTIVIRNINVSTVEARIYHKSVLQTILVGLNSLSLCFGKYLKHVKIFDSSCKISWFIFSCCSANVWRS